MRAIFAGACLVLSGWVHANPMQQHFGVTLEEANWTLERGQGECALVQRIPRFGEARFYQRSGEPFRFAIDVPAPPMRPEAAALRSVPPAWKHEVPVLELGSVDLKPAQRPLRLDRDLALRIFYELEKGMFPEVRYRDWADGRDEVVVEVSAVRFREVLPDFQACLAGLIHLDFKVAEEHRVHFATDSYRLNYRTRRELERVLRAYRKRQDIDRIVIAGHADERGGERYNDKLSYRRAREIKRYLVRRGIPEDRIDIRAFGESWPANPGSGPEAWAENRRATIWFAQRP